MRENCVWPRCQEIIVLDGEHGYAISAFSLLA